VHDGTLDLLIADSAEAEQAAGGLCLAHPSLSVLRIVESEENGPGEICLPVTQAALLDRVSALLGSRPRLESAPAS